jgi:E3 ubiquitin-protein ligase BRE1
LFCAEEAPNIDEVVRHANAEIQMENRNLQAINIQLHEKYHTISLKVIDFLSLVSLTFNFFHCSNEVDCFFIT